MEINKVIENDVIYAGDFSGYITSEVVEGDHKIVVTYNIKKPIANFAENLKKVIVEINLKKNSKNKTDGDKGKMLEFSAPYLVRIRHNKSIRNPFPIRLIVDKYDDIFINKNNSKLYCKYKNSDKYDVYDVNIAGLNLEKIDEISEDLLNKDYLIKFDKNKPSWLNEFLHRKISVVATDYIDFSHEGRAANSQGFIPEVYVPENIKISAYNNEGRDISNVFDSLKLPSWIANNSNVVVTSTCTANAEDYYMLREDIIRNIEDSNMFSQKELEKISNILTNDKYKIRLRNYPAMVFFVNLPSVAALSPMFFMWFNVPSAGKYPSAHPNVLEDNYSDNKVYSPYMIAGLACQGNAASLIRKAIVAGQYEQIKNILEQYHMTLNVHEAYNTSGIMDILYYLTTNTLVSYFVQTIKEKKDGNQTKQE